MDKTMTEDNIQRIADKIEALTESELRFRSSYLLSELGKDLGPDLSTLKLLTKSSLSNFIRDRFSDKFVIVLTGEFKNVQALIRSPRSPTEQPALTPLEKATLEGETTTAKPSPRFNYRFWAAFSVPYREGKRFLNLADFRFQDVTTGEAPEGYLEIPPSFIVEPDIKDRDKVIAENISRWIEENHLNRSGFYQTRSYKENFQAPASLSLLEAVIATLDHRQLSSTSMSLDVVAALMRKRV
jgi:hypothetical protein